MASARSLSSRSGEEPGGKAGERGEAHRAEYPASAHVFDALMHVVRARGASPRNDAGSTPYSFFRAARNGVQADIWNDGVVEDPDVGSVSATLDPRRLGRRTAAASRPSNMSGWFDEVIVDTHQDHVVGVHASAPTVSMSLNRGSVFWLMIHAFTAGGKCDRSGQDLREHRRSCLRVESAVDRRTQRQASPARHQPHSPARCRRGDLRPSAASRWPA